MKALLYKDYKPLEWYILLIYYIPTLIIFALGLFGKYSPLLGLIVFLLPAEFALGVSTADFKAKWDKYSEVLPISREKKINQKFLLILANSLYSLLFFEVGLIIGNLIHGEPAFNVNNAVVLITFFGILALCGFCMLMMFLVNYGVSIFLMGFSGGFFGSFCSYISAEESLFLIDTACENSFFSNSDFCIGVAVACTLIFVLSWIVTSVSYKRKNI